MFGGLPATTTTRSPTLSRPMDSSEKSTCADHVVGVLDRGHEERLDAPGQRQLAAHPGVDGEGQQRLAGVQRGQPPGGLAGLGERGQRLDVQRLADVLGRPHDRPGARPGPAHAASGTEIVVSLSTASMIRSIVRTAPIGCAPDRGLARQHHRVGAVEDGVGDVGGLGAGGPRVA